MPQILITIDTELGELGKKMPNAFEIFIEGKVDVEIIKKRNIIEKVHDNFTERVLRIRKI